MPTAAVTPGRKKRLRAPQAPASVSLTTGKSGSSVRITPPAADGGSPVTAYAVTAGRAGPPLVLEGLDVIHADAAHPVTRGLGGLPLAGASEVLVAAVNTVGPGKPAVLKVQK